MRISEAKAMYQFPADQSERNLAEAIRVMALLPEVNFSRVKAAIRAGRLQAALDLLDKMPLAGSSYVPHPIIIIKAEIKNAIRYANV